MVVKDQLRAATAPGGGKELGPNKATDIVPDWLESWDLVEDDADVTARHTSNESARCELGTKPEVPSVPVLFEGAYAGAVVIEVDVNVIPAKVTVEGTDTEGAAAGAHVTTAVGYGETALACAAKERSDDVRIPLGGGVKDGSNDARLTLGGVVGITQDTTTKQCLRVGGSPERAFPPSLSCSISWSLLP